MVLGGFVRSGLPGRCLLFREAAIGRRRGVNTHGEDARRAPEELMELKAARLCLSEDVMKGDTEALEEDRRLERRVRKLANQLTTPFGQEDAREAGPA